MMAIRASVGHHRSGFAACLALVLILLCATLSVALINSTSLSLAQADSLRKVTSAQLAAESGMQFMMYELQNTSLATGSSGQGLLDELAAKLQARLNGSATLQGGSISYDSTTVTLPSASLGGDGEWTFTAALSLVDDDTIALRVTGLSGGIRRAVGIDLDAVSQDSPIFSFGIASQSPVELTGNAKVMGKNSSLEAMILSATDEAEAFDLTGNVAVGGDIYTTNPSSLVSMSGNVSIAGVSCSAPEIDDHIHLGMGVGEFPEIDPTVFEPFATDIVDGSTSTSGNKTFDNIRIKAGTNPTFSGNIQINGVVFVEVPNKVHFSGNTTFTGVLVTGDAGDGTYDDNTVKFTGNVSVKGVEQLPDTADFHTLREMPGAFILAPGFGLSFSGNFGTVGGCIAADAFSFTGNAGGTIRGGVINYSDSMFKLTGNSTVTIDRQDTPDIPPGFIMRLTLVVSARSYIECPICSN